MGLKNMTKGITELLFSRDELVQFFTIKQLEYIRKDANNETGKTFSEYIADSIIEETIRIQDLR